MTQAYLPDVICTCYSGSCVSSGGAPTLTDTSNVYPEHFSTHT